MVFPPVIILWQSLGDDDPEDNSRCKAQPVMFVRPPTQQAKNRARPLKLEGGATWPTPRLDRVLPQIQKVSRVVQKITNILVVHLHNLDRHVSRHPKGEGWSIIKNRLVAGLRFVSVRAIFFDHGMKYVAACIPATISVNMVTERHLPTKRYRYPRHKA